MKLLFALISLSLLTVCDSDAQSQTKIGGGGCDIPNYK
jgi:hypothetical protein